MQRFDDMDAHVHYRHCPEEIAELSQAVIPMAESIAAVANPTELNRMHRMLEGRYFRSRDAMAVVGMLKRACKYAKQHLSDYFPNMRAQILDNALALEEAAIDYAISFQELKTETLPVS